MKKMDVLSHKVQLGLVLGLGLAWCSGAAASDVTYTNELLKSSGSGNVIENITGMVTLNNSQVLATGNIPTFLANLATSNHDWNAAITGGLDEGIGLVNGFLQQDVEKAGGLAGNGIVNVGGVKSHASIIIAGDKGITGVTAKGVVFDKIVLVDIQLAAAKAREVPVDSEIIRAGRQIGICFGD